ncbi:MAG: TraB/GumN family protein [Saprospiraceae bacterium]|nr:TraB/GumN family protein [Saprospiraceae bacterium]
MVRPGRLKSQINALLWSIENDSGGQGYLFGTMHVRDRSAFYLVDNVMPYLKSCGRYAAEMDLGSVDLSSFEKAAQLPENKTLRSFFSDRHYAKVRASFLKSFEIDIDAYQNRHPFLIISMLSEKLLRRDHMHSLDQHLWEMAGNMELDRIGLESYDAQIGIMESIEVRYQIKNLRDIARNPAKFRNKIATVVRYYEQQQVGKIYKESRRQLGKLHKLLLKDRNQLMADRISKSAAQEKLFAAFGAAHLGGKAGVIALLKRKGWKVRPVPIASSIRS